MAWLALVTIAAATMALGLAIWLSVRHSRAARIRDRRWQQLVEEMSGDAGGMPQASDNFIGAPWPPAAWRGTSGRR